MKPLRLIAGLALGLAAMAAAQAADNYPDHPIRLIATYGPGSSIDIIARLVAKPLGEQLGQPVIVENKPGAGGDLGTDIVAKSAKDGYTIGFASAGPITVNPNARKKMPYDALKDLAPVALVATGPNVILVNPSLPVKNLQELIAYIKANPNKVNFASAGVGTSGHIAGELFQHLSKTEILHVPYKGNSDAITDTLGGRTQMVISGVPPILSFVKSGQLRALAVADSKRSPLLPDVPTVAEAGLPGAESVAWYGIVAPAGTPAAVLARLHDEITKAVNSPDVQEKFSGLGIVPASESRERFGKLMADESARFKELFKQINLVMD
ncbi:Bug family tripartite tricarboxylate transporter substrate binding protein [Bordetella hinzii]|uniref:Tripartite tricarboxylate transporter family receptor n=1 Tax=Bordetella hinzii OH87 BAL007II TaxID=1331262 RepID=A0ABR4R7B5_9BORD|nr:tripartite tricarboxylate transporter substrate binding protein [Bordetella hinzii]KCB26537.1 tripartite tricarboxylate transporter family receptor [Bordetella hinzii OH87 BAL007II]KCB40960.1 tripartite tricarboxylate transporter family receptor [Bordetella hinzii 5132]KCB47914.1 tripartite tricarboxylate transporter family receptor [Bordetella hinzii 4161]MCJ9711267.1 tripartite tricarboxylate transporter substrate binding protein [Bordetella hinzii]QII84338.1 tripartite tricarboxylate tra